MDADTHIDATAKVCDPLLFCDNCEFYPIIPVHGHFECPRCHMPTKCCEGIAQDVEPS